LGFLARKSALRARRFRALEVKAKRALTRGERVCAFIEAYCLAPEGDKIGQPMKLEPFQRKFILEIYDNPYGTHSAYLSIARKNGKTA
jgi:phage terminase large subunit-like protein